MFSKSAGIGPSLFAARADPPRRWSAASQPISDKRKKYDIIPNELVAIEMIWWLKFLPTGRYSPGVYPSGPALFTSSRAKQ
jgi:hypothetical protein